MIAPFISVQKKLWWPGQAAVFHPVIVGWFAPSLTRPINDNRAAMAN
jgi:hypothetical protein